MKPNKSLLLSLAVPVFTNTALATEVVNLSGLDLNAAFTSSVGTVGAVVAPADGTTASATHTFTVSGLDIAEDGTANDEVTFSYDVTSINGNLAPLAGAAYSYGVDGAADPADNEIDLDEGVTFSNLTATTIFGDATSESLVIVSSGFTGFFSRFPGGGDTVNLTTIDDNPISITSSPDGGPNDPYDFVSPQPDFKVISDGGNGFGVDNLSATFTLSTTAEQSLFWDGTDIDSDANGGSGSWDLATTNNWDDASAGGADSLWVNGASAVFGGSASGTVTLAEPVTANALTYEIAGYEIAGDTLTMGGSSPEILTSADATISSDLVGIAPLNKSGSATLTLSGSNGGATGGLTITTGTVDLQSDFGSTVTVESTLAGEGSITGDLILESDATLSIDTVTAGALSVSGDVIISGPIELNLNETPTGDLTLLTYTGSVLGDLSDLVYTGRGQVVDTGSALVIQDAAAADLVWSNFGSSGFWSVGDDFAADQNWDNAGSNDFFFADDSVTFTDTAAGIVTLDNFVGPLEPAAVTFNNSLGNDYTLVPNVDAGIVGSTSLIKNGEGTVILEAGNTFTGGTFVNDGVLELAQGAGPIPTLVGEVTVTGPGVLNLNVGNALGFNAARRVDVLNVFDGGVVDHLAGGDNGFAIEYNLRGSTIQTSGAGQFAFAIGTAVNSEASADSSTIAGRVTIRSSFTFDVEDGAAATDLLVSADLVNQGAATKTVTKTGGGVLRFSGTAGVAGTAPESYGPTVVSEGCLIIDGLASITPDLTLVSVSANAGFGAIAGPSNATGDDFAAISSDVVWDGGGTSFLVIDTNGEDVVISGDFVGPYTLLKKGAGVLTLSGNVTVDTQEDEGSIVIDPNAVEPPRATDGIVITDCSSAPGTNSGLMFSVSFASSGDVDVYASSDLVNFGTPIAEDVSASPFVEDDVADAKRFYILVPAGQTFP
ncbi:MAG: beta strand repeat-containing protein [Roseibacillus sp.]